jgi:hypothetical protein
MAQKEDFSPNNAIIQTRGPFKLIGNCGRELIAALAASKAKNSAL